jgi:membrane associated rhomboid family serine protease
LIAARKRTSPCLIEACIAKERWATAGSLGPRAFRLESPNISCAGINNLKRSITMGVFERDYMRRSAEYDWRYADQAPRRVDSAQRSRGSAGAPPSCSGDLLDGLSLQEAQVSRFLCVACLAISLLLIVAAAHGFWGIGLLAGVWRHMVLVTAGLESGRYHTVLTYPLLDPAILSLIWHALGLWVFGGLVESREGGRGTLALLILAACLPPIGLYLFPGADSLSGAGGLVAALAVVALLVVRDDRRGMRPRHVWLAAVAYFAIDPLVSAGRVSGSGYLALLLGGAVAGFLYLALSRSARRALRLIT